jgi:hypothetical protein
LNSLEDGPVDFLKQTGRASVVVGASYIGLEVADAADRGLAVTVMGLPVTLGRPERTAAAVATSWARRD